MSKSEHPTPSRSIGVGDLVVGVYVCCDRQDEKYKILGSVFRVTKISKPAIRCRFCAWGSGEKIAKAHGAEQGAPLEWLRRIPPLAELEGEKQKEDIREPA